MIIFRYIQDKMIFILLNLVFDFLTGLLLLLYGCDMIFIGIILISRFIINGIYLGIGYLQLQKRVNRCNKIMKDLEKAYMASDLLSKPNNVEEEIYYEMLRTASKSMKDEVEQCKRSRADYKFYVEEWIHEVKNPLSAIKLLCFNNHTEITKEISREIEEIDYFLEQVLYYARSEWVEKDFFIRRFPLSDAINAALLRNRSILQNNGFTIEDFISDEFVHSDEKWITFILSQIISNAVKYHRNNHPVLSFKAEKSSNEISLLVEDNGIGISQSDLGRIFECGFTGSNRRKFSATGMGLFICKNLCDKMGLVISAESEVNCGTIIKISFPYGPLTEL